MKSQKPGRINRKAAARKLWMALLLVAGALAMAAVPTAHASSDSATCRDSGAAQICQRPGHTSLRTSLVVPNWWIGVRVGVAARIRARPATAVDRVGPWLRFPGAPATGVPSGWAARQRERPTALWSTSVANGTSTSRICLRFSVRVRSPHGNSRRRRCADGRQGHLQALTVSADTRQPISGR